MLCQLHSPDVEARLLKLDVPIGIQTYFQKTTSLFGTIKLTRNKWKYVPPGTTSRVVELLWIRAGNHPSGTKLGEWCEKAFALSQKGE
jgi:hypothetical protein